jgi:GGDEF domain-containing protein
MASTGYPDIESRLIAWLKTTLDMTHVYEGGPEDVPHNLTAIVPIVMVDRFGGSDATVSLDDANVDVEVYASTRTAAKALAERIRGEIRLNLTGKTLAGAVIARVATIGAPAVLPFDSGPVRRVGASYRIRVHRAI